MVCLILKWEIGVIGVIVGVLLVISWFFNIKKMF